MSDNNKPQLINVRMYRDPESVLSYSCRLLASRRAGQHLLVNVSWAAYTKPCPLAADDYNLDDSGYYVSSGVLFVTDTSQFFRYQSATRL